MSCEKCCTRIFVLLESTILAVDVIISKDNQRSPLLSAWAIPMSRGSGRVHFFLASMSALSNSQDGNDSATSPLQVAASQMQTESSEDVSQGEIPGVHTLCLIKGLGHSQTAWSENSSQDSLRVARLHYWKHGDSQLEQEAFPLVHIGLCPRVMHLRKATTGGSHTHLHAAHLLQPLPTSMSRNL